MTKAFLLTWNPRVFAWSDLARDLGKLRRGKLALRWDCGRSKQIREGDRLYLLRQGVEPRGIVGSGTALADWYEGESWRRPGVPSHYVRFAVDALFDAEREPILPRELLMQGKLGRMYWSPMISGVEIPPPVAAELDRVWRAFLAARG